MIDDDDDDDDSNNNKTAAKYRRRDFMEPIEPPSNFSMLADQ